MTTRPLVPDDLDLAASVPRAAFAALCAAARGGDPGSQCRRMFPSDHVAAALLTTRAAVTGGSTTGPGWAADVVGQALAEWLQSLYPMAAAGELIRRGLVVPLDRNGSIKVPGRATAPLPAPWVGEGQPIPARAYVLNSALLAPRKMGALVTWSRELQRSTAAEAVFTALLQEDAAASLDQAYFSAIAGSATAVAGLLNGLTSLPPATGPSAMSEDFSALARAVSPASATQLIYVASPGRAAAVNVLGAYALNVTCLGSLAVPDTRLIAVDALALVHAIADTVDIAATTESATILLNDVPADIGTPGAPATVGAPTQSLFQTAQLALRLLVDCSFGKRRTNAVAFIDPVGW